jgi:hypothetical protein
MYAQVSKCGVTPIAMSTAMAERACFVEANWGLTDLCVAYGLSLRQARDWGLYVSRGAGVSSIGIEDRRYSSSRPVGPARPHTVLCILQSMPFARPCFHDMLIGIEKAVARKLPGARRGCGLASLAKCPPAWVNPVP